MTRRGAIIGLDILVVALALLAAWIIASGGFVVPLGAVQISFRTPSRALLWAAVALALRLATDRRTGPFGLDLGWGPILLDPPAPLWAPAAPGWGRRLALASLGIGAGLVVLLHDQLLQPMSVPDLGDPLFSIWRIGWVLHQLSADPARLFDANIFYPERLTLTFSDPIILPALTVAPVLAMGMHPVHAYNLLLFSGFWLSGLAAYLLVERLTGAPRAAFVAGLMYACCAYRFEHFSHLELQMTHWMPLGLLALHLFVSTGRWPYIVALGLAGVAQLYSTMYYAVFFLVYAAAVGVGLLIAHRQRLRSLVLPAVGAALVAGLVALPLVRAFVAAQPVKGDRPMEEVAYYSATPVDYFRAHRHSALWHGRMLPPEPERALFPGVAPLVLAAVGLAPPLSAIQVVYAVALAVSLDGSFGANGALYPLLRLWLPPVRGLRVPARWAALVALTLAILAAFGVRRVLGRCRTQAGQRAVLAALTAAIIIDVWPALELTPVWSEPPAIYEALHDRPDAVLAEFPVETNEVFNLPYMYFSLWHWTPMVNGYSGFIPDSYAAVAPDLIAFPRGNTADALRRRGVTHVTMNCAFRYEGCEERLKLMLRSQDLRPIAETEWHGTQVRLFELLR